MSCHYLLQRVLSPTYCIIVMLPTISLFVVFMLTVHMIKFDSIESIISNHVREYTKNLESWIFLVLLDYQICKLMTNYFCY